MEEKLPFAGDIVRTTSVRRLNKLYFAYMNLSPEVQQAYKELILYCGGVEDLLQKSEIWIKNQRYEADSIHTGFRITIPEVPAINTSEFSDRAKYIIYHLEGDMTYDDA